MQWFENMKIGTKLILGFTFVASIAAFIGFMGVRNMGRIADLAQQSYERETMGISYLKEANIDLLYISRAEKNVLLATNAEERKQAKDEIETDLSKLEANMNKARPLIHTDEGKAALARFDLAWKERVDVLEQVMAMADQDGYDKKRESLELSATTSRQKVNVADNLLTDLTRMKEDIALKAAEETEQTYHANRNLLLLLVALGVVAGIGLGIGISRSIAAPIGKMAETARLIATGDVNQTVSYESANEVGSLAESFRALVVYIRGISAVLEQMAKGDLTAEAAPRSDSDVLTKSYLRTRTAVSTLVDEMRRMSHEHNLGDIDVRIPAEKFEGTYRLMAEAVNEMVSGHIAVKKKAMACVAEFGRGNFEAPLERFRRKKFFLNETI